MTVDRKNLKKKGSLVDAIQAEAKQLVNNLLGKWGTFLDVMTLPIVLKQPLFPLYPLFGGNKGIRPLLNGLFQPRVTSEKDSNVFYILWSREGGFDNQPGVVFQPNHFVPVIPHLSNTHPGMTASKDMPSLKIKASPLSSRQQGISAFFQPGKHALKRSSSEACLTSVIENGSVQSEKVPKKPVATVRNSKILGKLNSHGLFTMLAQTLCFAISARRLEQKLLVKPILFPIQKHSRRRC